jgi:hypothetical protein
MSALPPKAEMNYVCGKDENFVAINFRPLYFALPATHSSTKRERSSILIFCCSAHLWHSRIFWALSAGIIFSGAVAFIWFVPCAEAAGTEKIARIDRASTVVSCKCISACP